MDYVLFKAFDTILLLDSVLIFLYPTSAGNFFIVFRENYYKLFGLNVPPCSRRPVNGSCETPTVFVKDKVLEVLLFRWFFSIIKFPIGRQVGGAKRNIRALTSEIKMPRLLIHFQSLFDIHITIKWMFFLEFLLPELFSLFSLGPGKVHKLNTGRPF
jgi:hypothetical protein